MASPVIPGSCRGDHADIGNHGVGEGQTTKRSKRWATRARTGCLTCRARHVKCDEARPICLRCRKGGFQCRGYSVNPPSNLASSFASLQQSFNGTQSTRPGPDRRDVVQRRHNAEPEPPHWEQMEALRYLFDYIQPLLKGQALPKRMKLPDWNGPSGWSLLMRVSTHRINCTYRARGGVATAKEEPSTGGAWAVYSRQMGQLLALVNNGMKGDMESQSNKELLVRRIYGLVFYDLAVNASAWRLHALGYLALIQHLGGVRALMRDDSYSLIGTQWAMLNFAVAINTTSHPSMQLRGFEAYTDDDVVKLASHRGHQDFDTPVPLIIATRHVSRLRCEAADGTHAASALKIGVRDLLNSIIRFDAAQWAHNKEHPAQSEIYAHARIYQEAILLYGILSLPRLAVASWSDTSSHSRFSTTHAFQSVRLSHRRKLLDLLGPYRGTFENRLDMTWSLLVAGVSLGCDGSIRDRNFITESMLAIWSNPVTRCSPILCLNKLVAFWESGKASWDDCFDEPTPCLG